MTETSAAVVRLSKHEIAKRIPHAGPMCLLERVIAWDATAIVCEAINHGDRAHPLSYEGVLDVNAAIEYAAQAMAVHGAVLGELEAAQSSNDGRPRVGYLASVREVRFGVTRLDDLPGPLRIEATRLHAEDTRVMYAFRVTHDGRLCAEGRAAVVMDAAGILDTAEQVRS
jgi:predicted hotdog family 3-hydroxylacyl-ACP dehydratase